MNRTMTAPLVSLVAGLMASTVGLAVTTAPADAGDRAGLTTGARAIEPKVATRAYGDGPVRQDRPDQPIRIRFTGHQGDRVSLTDSVGTGGEVVRLYRPGGRPLWRNGSSYWRLPRSGTFVFSWRNHSDKSPLASVQLVKLLTYRAEVDREASVPPPRRGYAYGALLTVPEQGRITIRVADNRARIDGVIGPDNKPIASREDTAVMLEAGSEASWLQYTPRDRDVQAGQRFLVTLDDDRVPVRVTSVPEVTLDPDTGTATFAADGPVGGAQAIVFHGTAGQWVHPALTRPGRYGYDQALVLPSGKARLDGTVKGLYRLPVTGDYQLLVVPGRGDDVQAGDARLDAVDVATTPMPIDGTPVTFSTDGSGRWLVAPFPGTDPVVSLEATASSLTGDWIAYGGRVHFTHCSMNGPQGCSDFDLGYVDSVGEPSIGFYAEYLMIPFAPGQTGSLTLTASPPAA
jgi:hypothetical protein